MEVSNDGVSVFHRFQVSFVHDGQGNLLCSSGRSDLLNDHWSLIVPCLSTHMSITKDEAISPVNLSGPLAGLRLYQHHQSQRGHMMGLLLSTTEEEKCTSEDFERFFARLLLDQIDFGLYNASALSAKSPSSVTDQIVSLFDSFLRYQGADDKWEASGRAIFASRVHHFISQKAQIQLCLPAFPCKSSNPDKVTGKAPDHGEELALNRLHNFVEAVEQIYEPGAKLWVISDGHVFSDCIGVDDGDVDTYGMQLKKMNDDIGARRGRTGRVDFRSLIDLFNLSSLKSEGAMSELASHLGILPINHHVQTQVTEEAEVCRQILMSGCQPRESTARERIKSQDASLLALYRGFSRFMLEDLELHPYTQDMSRSQRKKLSTKVAFEMIMRNQAYSNLVEMLFPNYVRLSIHAHNNAGPKFGIQLFDPAAVRVVENLSPEGIPMTSRDLLHIPTPWHNCVVDMEGSDFILVTKAKIPRQSIASGAMVGGISHLGRAHFVLKWPIREVYAPSSTIAKESPIVTPVLQRSMSSLSATLSKPPMFYQRFVRALASVPLLMSLGFLVVYRFKL